jgi:hypothetical protein
LLFPLEWSSVRDPAYVQREKFCMLKEVSSRMFGVCES